MYWGTNENKLLYMTLSTRYIYYCMSNSESKYKSKNESEKVSK